jgi:hypothetical protein
VQTQDRKRKAKFSIDDETECDDSNDGVIRSVLVLIVSSIFTLARVTISCSIFNPNICLLLRPHVFAFG